MDGFSERATEAYEQLCHRERRDITYDEIAQRFARRGGREPVKDVTIGRWLRGERRPKTLEDTAIFAEVLEVQAGWLAFRERGGRVTASGAAGDYSTPETAALASDVSELRTKTPQPRGARKRKRKPKKQERQA